MSFYFEYPWKQWKALTPIDFLVEKSKIQHFDKKLTLEVRNRSLSKIYKFHDIYQNWLKQCFFFPWNFFFLPWKISKKVPVKLPVKKNENKKCAWNQKSVRERCKNFKKVPVKQEKCAWKKWKKCPWKQFFAREKNRKKGPKWLSRTLLVFTGKKNIALKPKLTKSELFVFF